MKTIEIEMLINTIATLFTVIGILTYAIFNAVYAPVIYVALFCLVVGKWIDIIERIEIGHEIEKLEDVIKCKGAI